MTTFFRRLRHLIFRARHDAELREEIEVHRALRQDALEREGLAPDEAVSASQRALGNVTLAVEDVRDVWVMRTADRLWQDVRAALRGLRRSPGVAFVVILTLALGIGANTTIFTLLDAVVLAPLPVAAPDELFAFYQDSQEGTPDRAGGTGRFLRFSYRRFERLQRALGSHGSLAAVTRSARLVARIPGSSERRYVRAQMVSGNYFSTLGITAAPGRVLGADDVRVEKNRAVAVVSHRFWRQTLGGADVLGRVMTVNDVGVTIVGVARQGFVGLWSDSEPDVWLPLTLQPALEYASNYSTRGPFDVDQPWVSQDVAWLNLFARVPSGDIRGILPALQAAFREGLREQAAQILDPNDRESLLTHTLATTPLTQGFSGLRRRYTPVLIALTVMAALVLLVTCANVASLLLARAAARGRELAVRLSLGATRSRLVRQHLTESFILALAGAAGGAAISAWASTHLASEMLGGAASLPLAFTPGTRALTYGVVVSIATALVFGVAPAIRAATARGTLAGNQRESVGEARTRGVQWLVAGQLALSVALVVTAALLGRTLVNFMRIDPGFATARVLSVSFDPVSSGYRDDQLQTLTGRLLAAAAAVPGVSRVSAATCGLLDGCYESTGFDVEGLERGARTFMENDVSAGYFSTVGVALAAGRAFDERDTMGRQPVAIVNEAAVDTYFGGRSPLGRHMGQSALDTEIVGVVRDAHTQTLHEDAVPMAYFPLSQSAAVPRTLDVRVADTTGTMAQAIREALGRSEPDLLIDAITPMSSRMTHDLARERLSTMLAVGFAGVTLLLAGLGLYGMLSFSVARRTQEIGVRIALGATRSEVMWLVGRQSTRLAAIGIVGGIGATVAASRYLSGLLYGVSPFDPVTLVLVSLILVAVVLVASGLPARRAATVDPLVALRDD